MVSCIVYLGVRLIKRRGFWNLAIFLLDLLIIFIIIIIAMKNLFIKFGCSGNDYSIKLS